MPFQSQSKSLAPASLTSAVVALVKGAASFVRAAWISRRNRREVAWLLHLDDHMLADIGLTHGDVVASLIATEPMFGDPSTRLRVLAVERRAGLRAQARERLFEQAPAPHARRSLDRAGV